MKEIYVYFFYVFSYLFILENDFETRNIVFPLFLVPFLHTSFYLLIPERMNALCYIPIYVIMVIYGI